MTAAIEAQPIETQKGISRPVMAAPVAERPEEQPRDRPENRNRRGNTKGDEDRPPLKCWVCKGSHVQRFCPEVSKLRQTFAAGRREAAAAKANPTVESIPEAGTKEEGGN